MVCWRPPRGILHAPKARRAQRSYRHKSHQSRGEHLACLSRHRCRRPTAMSFPSTSWATAFPSASWPFHWPLGEPFPPLPKHINPAKAATDIGCPPLLVSGPWPLQGKSLTLRYPGRGCGVEGPASHTVLRVSCTLSSSTCGMFQGALGHPSRVA